MVHFSGENLTENLVLLVTTVVSLAAWVISFGGLCALRVTGASWWVMIFELLLIVGVVCLILTGTFVEYRLVVLAFLAVSVSYLTSELSAAVPLSTMWGYSYQRAPAGAYSAGYILLIMIQIIWVLIFGSEPHSYLGRFGQHGSNSVQHTSGAAAAAGAAGGFAAAQSHSNNNVNEPIEMTQDKTAYEGQPTHESSGMSHPSMATSPVLEYTERVEALHEYQANPEDPSELSFERGDLLEIVDRRGNWWQARKADGSTGIIPSNYFA
ncbi:hypothetical protein [Absidia glauca]|uniref:SH3 domain-containing protein n=1 Tax=Absidia glauca TaxID=4829 RepID=A0A168NZI3_ABSGL|nr:hypothetical protein [Absidia glauca]